MPEYLHTSSRLIPARKASADIPDAVRPGIGQALPPALPHPDHRSICSKPARAHLQAPQRFLHRLLKRATNGHHLTHRFHLRGEAGIGLWKFLKGKARNLGDHIVDAGSKEAGVRRR